MPSFDELFDSSKERPVSYQGKDLYRADHIDVPKKCSLLVRFVSTNSTWKQGIGLNVDGTFTVNNNLVKRKTVLWEDTALSEVTLGIKSRDGKIGLFNLWDRGDGSMQFWRFGAAMMIEEIPGGKRYYCNDGHPDEDFDDLIFEVEILEPQQ